MPTNASRERLFSLRRRSGTPTWKARVKHVVHMRFPAAVQLSRLLDTDATTLFLLTIAGIIGGLFAASEVPNVDDAWLLIATGRFMDGAVIGRGLFEMNPPLIYWLMAPAVWFKRQLGGDYYTIYCLWVGLLASLSSILTFKTLVQVGISEKTAWQAAFAGLLLFVLVSGPDYGQRDPLAYELSAPFLATEAFRVIGRRTPTALTLPIAVLAAIGFLVKPYMAFVPVVLFAWRIIRERRLTAIINLDAITMFAIAVVYVTYVAIWTPGYLGLARLVMIAYPAYDSPPSKLLLSYLPVVLVSLVLWLALVTTSQRTTAAAVRVFLVAMLAFMAGGLTQLKGWYYHLVPCYLALCGACIIYLALQTPRASTRLFPRWLALALPAMFVTIGMTRGTYFQRGSVMDWDIAKAINNDRGPFLAITSSMWGVFPAVNEMGVEWASRSEAQWMVPAAVELSQGTPQQREEANELRSLSSRLITADLEKWKPHTVAIMTDQDQAMSEPLDWISFFSEDQQFRALWSSYCAEGREGKWAIYRRCQK
jgi:hypothetical protein